MSTNSLKPLSQPSKNARQSLEFLETKGYDMAKIKNCKDPISGYLPGTAEHRAFMKGWNTFVKEHTNKERKDNVSAR